MKHPNGQSGRLADLGIPHFETIQEVEHVQADMLRLLERSALDPGYYAGLVDCRHNFCEKLSCTEACGFGSWRRRLLEIQAAYRLLHSCEGPFYEVRVVRRGMKPAGELAAINIASAKQKNLRALDKLRIPSLVAVGMLKASPKFKYEGGAWVCEIHQIVAGAEWDDLGRVLARKGYCEGDALRVKKVENVAETISQVLRRDVRMWQHLSVEWPDEQPNSAQRTEYYAWLLGLRLGTRAVRYGCDRAFNQVPRPVRVRTIKARKKRPYPIWLVPFQFGSDWWEHRRVARNLADRYQKGR